MNPVHVLLALILYESAEGLYTAAVAKPGANELAIEQVDWLRSRGGYFHANLTINELNNSNGSLGIFASRDLPKGEMLFIIPRTVLLPSPESDAELEFMQDGLMCASARFLLKEYMLGETRSDYWSYVNYLFSSGAGRRLPSAWSYNGKRLLHLIGDGLVPRDLTSISAPEQCPNVLAGLVDDKKSPYYSLVQEAYFLVLSRSWEGRLVSVFDMLNHGRGNTSNVDSNSVHQSRKDLFVFTSRNVRAGEQLLFSYHDCTDCDDYTSYSYVLQHMLRDFGFVEPYPQRWMFPTGQQYLLFDLDITSELERFQIVWSHGSKPELTPKEVGKLESHGKRLEEIFDAVYDGTKHLKSSHERSVILEFYEATKTALEQVILSVTNVDSSVSTN